MCLLSAARLSEDTEQGRWSILPSSNCDVFSPQIHHLMKLTSYWGHRSVNLRIMDQSAWSPPPTWENGKDAHTERSSKISTISFTLPTGFLRRRSSIEINFLRPQLVLIGGFKNATVLCVLCLWTARTLFTIPLLGTTAAAGAAAFESSISFEWITSRGRPHVFNTSSKSVFWYCS